MWNAIKFVVHTHIIKCELKPVISNINMFFFKINLFLNFIQTCLFSTIFFFKFEYYDRIFYDIFGNIRIILDNLWKCTLFFRIVIILWYIKVDRFFFIFLVVISDPFFCTYADGRHTQYILHRCTVFEQYRPFCLNTEIDRTLLYFSSVFLRSSSSFRDSAYCSSCYVHRTFSFSSYCYTALFLKTKG
jgi:hypothetical protein